MKTPDEIKKALECCFQNSEQCADCPYYPTSCDRELVRDAREYIRQLEDRLSEVCGLAEVFRDKAVQLKMELDAHKWYNGEDVKEE